MPNFEPSIDRLISVAEAITILDSIEVETHAVDQPLMDSHGFRLSENIVADRDSPAFEKALMDGFAVRCDEIASVPIELSVAATIAAGSSIDQAPSRNSAIAIMTGAPFPTEFGFDGLVPVEDTSRISADRVRIHRAALPGRFIAKRGSDCMAGQTVLSRGTLIGPAQIAVAGSVGATVVSVFAKPKVGVLTTGDEIVPLDATPGPTQLRNTNSAMLAALIEKLGADVREFGIVRDDPKLIRESIERALVDVDVLFITGGMSMGEFDFVPRVLVEMGAELHITKLRIKPGKPFVFATFSPLHVLGGRPGGGSFSFARTEDKTPSQPPPEYRERSKGPTPSSQFPMPKNIFGLPGNPVSGFVCTMRLASRLIARLGGGPADAFEQWSLATLCEPLEANGPREFYQPAILRSDATVQPLRWKGSADIFTLAGANALLVREENELARAAGDVVRVLRLLT